MSTSHPDFKADPRLPNFGSNPISARYPEVDMGPVSIDEPQPDSTNASNSAHAARTGAPEPESLIVV